VDPNQFFTASRVFIVAGKGGVGKSKIAAALTLAAQRCGLTSLLVETDGKPVPSGISSLSLTPPEALREYLDTKGLGRISRLMITTGVLDVITSAAPGIDDLLVLGKIKHLERSDAADVIVVDGPAAGHAITMLRTPQAISDSVKSGAVRLQADEILEMLRDGSRCQVVLVTIPEPTPVQECIETAYALEEEVGVKLAPIVVNQVDTSAPLDIPLSLPERSALAQAAEFRNAQILRHHTNIKKLEEQLPLAQLIVSDLTSCTVEIIADQLLAAIEEI
jgi:anion-transporting  ArsA/GET3 family ATPase